MDTAFNISPIELKTNWELFVISYWLIVSNVEL